MSKELAPKCARCEEKKCSDGKDCFGQAEHHQSFYEDPKIKRLHKAASAIEARHYCQEPRISEIILFAKELGCKKLGVCFCVGLAPEAKIVDEILSEHFDVVSVCCKACGLKKNDLGLEKIEPEKDEVMCNPAGQADLLNQAGTELNVLCGLCVGHDAIFYQVSQAPVTTLIAKDRVLGHNPVAAIYCRYIRKKYISDEKK